MTDIATRDDIEAALWRWSGWQADQRSVDELLGLIDQYAQAPTVPRAARVTDEVLAAARREAEQIVQSARDEIAIMRRTAERPPDGMKRLAPGIVPVETYKDADGAIWVRLTAPVSTTPPGTRRCRGCGVTKPMIMFRKDKSCTNGYRHQCKECENAGRRNRHAHNRLLTKEVA